MLCGRPPFESQEVKNTYKKIKAGAFQFPGESASFRLSSYAKDFIRKCLIVDPAKRMDLQEMLNHDFLALVPIPVQLPVSTLVCPPTGAFEAAYNLPHENTTKFTQERTLGMSNSTQAFDINQMGGAFSPAAKQTKNGH